MFILYYIVPYISIGNFNNIVPDILCNLFFIENLQKEREKMSPTSKAQQKATAKYMKNNYDEIKIRVFKGKKVEIQNIAEQHGESLNAYIKKAVREQYKKDTGNDIEL